MALELKGYTDEDLLDMFIDILYERVTFVKPDSWNLVHIELALDLIEEKSDEFLKSLSNKLLFDVDPEYSHDKYDEGTRAKLTRHASENADRVRKLLKFKPYERNGEDYVSFDKDKVQELIELKKNAK